MRKRGKYNFLTILLFILFVGFLTQSLEGPFIFSIQDLTYGTKINKFIVHDYEGKKLTLPFNDSLTLIYFFNIKNHLHLNNLLELDYLERNLNHIKPILRIVGISKGKDNYFQKIFTQYKLNFFLVNDKKNSISKRFQTNCNFCLKVILIDKSSRIRYVASHLDLFFLREIIYRYASEES